MAGRIFASLAKQNNYQRIFKISPNYLEKRRKNLKRVSCLFCVPIALHYNLTVKLTFTGVAIKTFKTLY